MATTERQQQLKAFTQILKETTSYQLEQFDFALKNDEINVWSTLSKGIRRDVFHATDVVCMAEAIGLNCYISSEDGVLTATIF